MNTNPTPDALAEREYRKTATIRAMQWFKMGDHPAVKLIGEAIGGTNPGQGWIDTLEGGHIVTPGDWIATGVKGEHWPIKPDIFAATYQPVCADSLEAFHAKPVGDEAIERAARALVIARGAAVIGKEPTWSQEVARYREVCAEYPDYVDALSLINDAFRDARAVVAALAAPKHGEVG